MLFSSSVLTSKASEAVAVSAAAFFTKRARSIHSVDVGDGIINDGK